MTSQQRKHALTLFPDSLPGLTKEFHAAITEYYGSPNVHRKNLTFQEDVHLHSLIGVAFTKQGSYL